MENKYCSLKFVSTSNINQDPQPNKSPTCKLIQSSKKYILKKNLFIINIFTAPQHMLQQLQKTNRGIA